MSGTDDAAVQIVFRADPMANRDKIISALRKAGHLRTPGTVELSREDAESLTTTLYVGIISKADVPIYDRLTAALAAGEKP